MTASPADLAPVLHDDGVEPLRPPLSRPVRGGLLALVVFFHVGGGWALTQIEPARLVVGDIAAMEVRMVAAEQPPQPQPETPPPEETPPPPELESMIQPPPPDLPPPVFPVEVKPPPPPKPKPPPPRPAQAAPAQPSPPAAAPAQPAGPKTVAASQVAYLDPPNPVYPARSRRAGEKGTVMVKVLIDVTGRPAQVALQASSGHVALDEAAVSAVRAARFRAYAEGGVPQAVWVLIPINFVLK